TSKVKNSINEKLFDKEKGVYVDGIGSLHSSIHSNMLALAFDIVPEENKKSVVEFVKSRGMACSVYGAQYLLEGLYRAGEAEYALNLMTSTNDRSWWNMIRVGSTMTMEAWDMKYKPNSDWNHAWGAAPANIIPRWMWGIRPASSGFEKVIIEPQLSNLKESSIEYPTIKGIIKARFILNPDGSREYNIELPAGMKGKFVDVENGKQFKLKSALNKITL
ncbi:alpha-L-rhamnosidase-related protein, partial [Mariniphaga sediminis]|uniref:alpha-L-rhamnosidase-related protein n=1 Tax=Mariniphaga sediminis TaxID=1628158 RepID=UPI00356B25E0